MNEKVELKIEHGIPITKCSRDAIYVTAFRQMKIGDSFVLPIKSRAGPYLAARRLGIKVIVRKINDTEVRIWRVK